MWYIFRILYGISSWIYKSSPSPVEFLSNLQGALNSLIKDWAVGNESPILVSEIKNMSMLLSMINFSASNLNGTLVCFV